MCSFATPVDAVFDQACKKIVLHVSTSAFDASPDASLHNVCLPTLQKNSYSAASVCNAISNHEWLLGPHHLVVLGQRCHLGLVSFRPGTLKSEDLGDLNLLDVQMRQLVCVCPAYCFHDVPSCQRSRLTSCQAFKPSAQQPGCWTSMLYSSGFCMTLAMF